MNPIRLRCKSESRFASSRNTPSVAQLPRTICSYIDGPPMRQAHPEGHKIVTGQVQNNPEHDPGDAQSAECAAMSDMIPLNQGSLEPRGETAVGAD